ncbi:MAG: sigma-70 family RNA polymerase sigma factor, partial [Actinobacteria bacterium]|nr:sigma-70 family RNA polymerase sigma factor [Actinomycetota bacterium]
QEIFLQVLRKIGSFEGRSLFSTWLYRVATNRSRDYLRGKKRTPNLVSHDDSVGESGPDEYPGHVETTGEPETRALSSEAQALVQDALLVLPVSLRTPLVLHELEGLQYQEVAQTLHLPVGTVKSRIFRARIKLAEILEPHKEHWR